VFVVMRFAERLQVMQSVIVAIANVIDFEVLSLRASSPPAVVLDVGGGVHAAWLAGRGYLRCSRTQLDNVVVFAWRKAVRLTTRRSVDHHHKRFGRQAGPGV
jgi:hypothetical protein